MWRRHRFVAQGICTACRKRVAKEGRTKRRICLEGQSEEEKEKRARKREERAKLEDPKPRLSHRERKALGICRYCEEEVGGGSTIMCPVHIERMRGHQRKYKAKRKAEAEQDKVRLD